MADRQVRIIISADVAAAIRGMRDVEGGLGRVGAAGNRAESQTSSFGDKMQKALGAAGVTLGIAGIVGGLKQVISTGMDYEKSIHTFQAVTGASADVMKRMADTAKQLGNDVSIPGASAQSTAAAMTELAKGGFNAQQSMEAARGTMVLAAAAQIDGAQAAEIQANAMNMFSLKADQASRVADILANTANASSGEITDFAQALSQSGTVANAFGVSIEDTSTMLGLFANAGIKGSDAGTSFKTMLTALNAPTAAQQKGLDALGLTTRNAAGEFIGMRSITEQLAGAHGRLSSAEFDSAAQAAFGSDAIRGGLVASAAATEGWDKMSTAVTKAGGAQTVAAANAQGFTGALDGLMNSASTAALALYEAMAPALTGVATATGVVINVLGDVIGLFGDLPGPVQAGVVALGAVIFLKGPLNAFFMQALAGYTRLGAAAIGAAAAVRSGSITMATFGTVAKTAFAALGGLPMLAIVGVTTALTFLTSGTDDAAAATQDYADVVDEQTGALKENAAQLISSKVEASGLGDKWRALGGDTSVLVDAIGKVPGAAEKANEFLTGVKQAAIDQGIALQGATGAATDYTAATQGAASTNVISNLSFGAGTAALGTQSEGYKTATEAQDLFNQQTGLMNQALDTQKNTAAGTTGELGKVAGATTDAGAAAAASTEQVTPFSDAMKKLKDATSEADAAAQYLNISLLTLAGSTIDADTRARANEAAMRGMAAANRDVAAANQAVIDKQTEFDNVAAHLGTTLNGQEVSASNLAVTQADVDKASRELADAQAAVTDAGDKQSDAINKAGESARGMAADAFNAASKNSDLAGAAAYAGSVMVEQRQKFLDAAAAMGIGGDQANYLADQQGLIPENVVSTYSAPGVDDAIAKAEALNAKLTQINGRTITYTAVGTNVYQDLASSVPVSALAALHADGGWITGPGGPREDKVPARLSPGEFVVNAAAAGKNKGLLEAINGGALGFADGGEVPAGGTGASAAVAVSGAVAVPDVAAIETAWAAISAAVQNAWAQVIQPTLDLLAAATAVTSADFLALQSGSVEPSWAANSDAISTAVNGTIIPTYTVLNAGTEFVGAEFQALFAGSVAPVWTNTGALIAATWAGPIAGTYAALNAGSNFVGSTFQLLSQTAASTWGAIGSSINATYTGQIVPAWNGVQGFANSMGGFFSGLQTNVSASATSVTGDLAEITTAINDFFTLVDGKAPAATTAAAAASVTANVAAFADGGEIKQGTTGRADDVLIRASKGEYVVNAKAAAANKDTLDAINYGGAFADGGMVGTQLQTAITDGAQRAISAGVDQVIKAMAPTISGFSGPVPAGARGAFLNAVLSKQGTEYVWGADGPDVFDCSGLMSWGLIQAGVGKGRLTAAEFGDNFPRVSAEKPGDMAIFDTGRVSPKAGHIGAVLDPNAGTMMHTDGAGPARISPYRGRSGLMGFIDAIGGDYSATPSAESKAGDPPAANWKQALLDKIKTGVTNGVAVGQGGTGAAAMNTVDPIQDFGAQNMARGNMSMVGPVPAGGAEERWRPMVEAILTMKGKPLGENTTRAMYQMHTESGGDPLAYNDWDSNYTAGHPSKSLWQTIPGTFRRWADPGFNTNIWHPESNFRAASNYVDANYGGIFPGRAYANGGIVGGGNTPGQDSVHAFVSPGEAFLTNTQWQTARAATLGAGGDGSAPVIHITNYVDAAGILSRTEAMVDGKVSNIARVLTVSQGQS